VEFTVTPEMLSILNIDMHRVVEPGVFELMVGPSSDETNAVQLTVAGTQGETGRPALPPPPAGSESGMVSNFDDGKVAANYGMWIPAGDSMNGGKSTATLEVAQPGADGTKSALKVNGEIVGGTSVPFTFAGVLYSPGAGPMQPVNLSSKKGISFWTKGDGKSYTLIVLTEERNGRDGPPAMSNFIAGPKWKHHSFPFSTFETDGSDLSGLGFVHVQEPGVALNDRCLERQVPQLQHHQRHFDGFGLQMPVTAARACVLATLRALVLARPAQPVRLGIQKPVQRLLNRRPDDPRPNAPGCDLHRSAPPDPLPPSSHRPVQLLIPWLAPSFPPQRSRSSCLYQPPKHKTRIKCAKEILRYRSTGWSLREALIKPAFFARRSR
jgi:hypothetical protein